MALKFVILAVLIAVSEASHYEFGARLAPRYYEAAPVFRRVAEVPIVAPVTKTLATPAVAEYDFGHSLSDPYTNNHQSRTESRRGDVVTGSYSLLEADGSTRIVDYTATPLTGFRAVVRKEGLLW